MCLLDDIMWWGLWGFRLALAFTAIFLIFGVFDKYFSLK